jgi:hypothetical protein
MCGPAASPVKVPETWNDPPLRLYSYGEVPPDPATVTLPVELPKQRTFVCELMVPDIPVAGCVIDTLADVAQLFASVIVTVYDPADRPVAVAVVWTGVVFHE